MRTVKTIPAGKKTVVVRSNGQVYIVDSDKAVDLDAKLVATTALACFGLSEAFQEASDWLRENEDKLVHKQ